MTTNHPELKACELKSCPFCPDGGKPYKSDAANESNDTGGRMVYVGCANCGVHLKAANYPQMDGSWKMSKDIVSIWNARPSPIIPEDADMDAAPSWYSHEQASAWAAGWNKCQSMIKQPVTDDALQEALKLCPFCGSTDIEPDGVYHDNGSYPACNNCSASCENWNTRHESVTDSPYHWQFIQTHGLESQYHRWISGADLDTPAPANALRNTVDNVRRELDMTHHMETVGSDCIDITRDDAELLINYAIKGKNI